MASHEAFLARPSQVRLQREAASSALRLPPAVLAAESRSEEAISILLKAAADKQPKVLASKQPEVAIAGRQLRAAAADTIVVRRTEAAATSIAFTT